jgi:hypothetical protein
MATFGYSTVGSAEQNWSGTIGFSKYTLGEAGTVTSMSIYVANSTTNTHEVRGVIYDDDYAGGAPATFLRATVSDDNAVNSAGRWLTLDLTAPLALTAGDYWLGILTDDTTAEASMFAASSGGSGGYQDGINFGSPGNIAGIQGANAVRYSVYATYTPSAPAGFTGLTVTKLLNG